jgi:hypothetical protein
MMALLGLFLVVWDVRSHARCFCFRSGSPYDAVFLVRVVIKANLFRPYIFSRMAAA